MPAKDTFIFFFFVYFFLIFRETRLDISALEDDSNDDDLVFYISFYIFHHENMPI